MNDKSQDHLISAYHDGELSAVERTAVERLLATSAEARAELESYRKLSNLLRTVERPSLDANLAPLVMQTIEQRMLLPTVPQRAAKSRTWAKWAGAIVTAAAGIMIAVSLMPPAKQDAGIVNNQNPTVKSNDTTNSVNQQALATNNAMKPDVKPNLTPEKIGSENVNPAPQLVAADLPLDLIQDLKKAVPGQIVRFLKNSGKEVAVFHLMVLDVQPGLESLQMILSAQQISGPMTQANQSGVVAVYVQADQKQLDKVIAELLSKEQEQFVALAVQQQPVKADALKKVVGNQQKLVASSQMPLKRDKLTELGVNEVQSEQIVAATGPRIGQLPPNVQSLNGGDPANRKVLIVVERVPEELRPKSATPQN